MSPSLLSIRRSISGSKRMSLFLSIGLLRLFDLRSVRAAPDDEEGSPLELGAAAESRAAAEDEWWTGGAEVGGAPAVVAVLEELLFDEEEPVWTINSGLHTSHVRLVWCRGNYTRSQSRMCVSGVF